MAGHGGVELAGVLVALDVGAAAAALDGAYDKFEQFDETGVMVDHLVDDYPALARMVSRLAERVGEELHDRTLAEHVVIGCAIGLLAVVQYATAEQLRRQVEGDAGIPDDRPG